MEISRDVYLQVFKNNFKYDIVDTELGQAIKMPAIDAFIYCCVTGSGYLENPIYPFSPKGLVKLFYNAFNYNLVTGIFDNTTLRNTPYIFYQAKPFLFDGPKYIVPFEFKSEVQLTETLKAKFSSINNPENYIVQRIEASKSGYGMEPFLEYLTAEYFKNKGFIVENQIPLAHNIGSPDFGAYGLDELLKELNSYNYLPSSGFHIIELAMIRINKQAHKSNGVTSKYLIVGEAKTERAVAVNQLKKYLNTDLFDIGIEIHPNQTKPTTKYLGLITIDSNYKIALINPSEKYEAELPLSKDDYIKWLNNYMKFYLMANFSNDEFDAFYYETFRKHISSQRDIVTFVTSISITSILNKIRTL